MNYDNFEICLNKNDVLQCGSNVNKLIFSYNRKDESYKEEIYDKCHYVPVFGDELLNKIYIHPKEDSLIGYGRLDYNDFLYLLCDTLNIQLSEKELNEEKIIKLIEEKSLILENIKNGFELKEKFPKLYIYYNDIYKDYRFITAQDDFGGSKKEIKEKLGKLFDKGFKPKLNGKSVVKGNTLLKFVKNSSYCECQANAIKQIIKHKDEIKRVFDETVISRNFFEDYKMDNDKFLIYLLYKYIDKAYILEGKDKEDLLHLIKINLNKVKDRNTSILIDNKTINYDYLVKEYNRVCSGKKNIRTIFIDDDILKTGHVINHQDNNAERKVKKLTIDEINYLVEYNEDLIKFYEDTNPTARLIVKNGLEGDTAFVYPNGEIIVDYIAPDQEEANLKKLKSRGIYHFNISNFNRLQGTSRMVLRKTLKKEKPESRVFTTHKGDWKERVLEMINEGIYRDFNEAITDKFLDELEEKQKIKRLV